MASGLDDERRQAGQVGGEEGVPQHVHDAMEVQNNMPKFDSVDGDLGGRDGTQCGCGHGHRGHRPAAAAPMTTPGAAAAARRRRCRQGRLTAAGLLRGSHAARYSRRISPSVGIGWAAHPGGLARAKPLLKFPAGRRAIDSLAARQVTRRHRITVIRAAGAPQNRSTTDRREYAGSGPLLPSPWIALLRVPVTARLLRPTRRCCTRGRRRGGQAQTIQVLLRAFPSGEDFPGAGPGARGKLP